MAESIVTSMAAGLRGLPAVDAAHVDASLHRLQWNESAYDYPEDLKQEVLQRLAAREWSRYPLGLRPFGVIAALAAHMGVEPARVVASGGSSDMIRIVLGALLGPEDVVVMPTPTFTLYKRTARMVGAAVHECALDAAQGFALPVAQLAATASAHSAKAVAICAPNNPTGTVCTPAEVAALAENCGCALVVDEAYLEFSGQDLLPVALAHPNVILIRTLSKAFRLAGARLGYAVAAPEVATELQKAVTSFALSVFQETVAEVALAHSARFAAGAAAVVAERERLAAALGALPGVMVFPSGTNFLLVQPPHGAQAIHRHLLETHRVLVSDNGGYPELAGMLRVSVGTPEQNDLVVRGFAECLGVAG